ncbi:MAG: acyltransferase family protein [Silicimonas sp.]|nr:acyltransferase family protein [Silicimonas sp.]
MAERIHALDGLRGWAALLVMLLHVYLQILPPDGIEHLKLELWWPLTGKFAVAVFFLVTGFSLSVGFLNTGNAALVVRMVFGRYFRLIIPVFATCALTSAFMNAGLFMPVDARPDMMGAYYSFEPTLAHLVRFALFDVIFDYSTAQSYAPPLWVISFEFFGSLIIAAMLLGVGDPARRPAMYLAALIGLYLYHPWFALFVLGIVSVRLRDVLKQHATPAAGGYLMVLGCTLSVLFGENPYTLSLAAFLFFLGAFQLPVALAFFSNRASRALGEISYPLYLLHVPVSFVVGLPIYVAANGDPWLQMAAAGLAAFASLLAAVIFIPVNTAAMSASRWVGKRAAALILRPAPATGSS